MFPLSFCFLISSIFLFWLPCESRHSFLSNETQTYHRTFSLFNFFSFYFSMLIFFCKQTIILKQWGKRILKHLPFHFLSSKFGILLLLWKHTFIFKHWEYHSGQHFTFFQLSNLFHFDILHFLCHQTFILKQ